MTAQGVFQRIHDILVLEDRVVQRSQVHVPSELPEVEDLLHVHDKAYLQSFLSGGLGQPERKRIGFGDIVSEAITIERTLSEVAGTYLTAELALSHGLAVNTAGGTHHAHRTHGSGFCILNDLAFTAEKLIRIGAVKRMLIVDLDVHQGDGTAAILTGQPHAFTFSVHAASNFPTRKQRSDLDIGLPDGVGDAEYLRVVGGALPPLLQEFRPDLVLYDAGVDPHEDDALGRLCLSDSGLLRRDLLVLDTCLAAGIPVAGVVGGGYNSDLNVLARRHSLLHRAALQMWEEHGL